MAFSRFLNEHTEKAFPKNTRIQLFLNERL